MKKIIVTITIELLFIYNISAVYSENEVYNYNAIKNSGFEQGLASWLCPTCDDINNISYSGNNSYLSLGDYNLGEVATQNVDIPNDVGQVVLNFDFTFSSYDVGTDDFFSIFVEDRDSGITYYSDTAKPEDGVSNEWMHYPAELLGVSGKKISIYFMVLNDSYDLTWINIDNVKLRIKSYTKIDGIVVNSKGKNIEKAKIIIRDGDDNKIWSGKTNKYGEFFVPRIEGIKGKSKITVRYSGKSINFYSKIKWGEQYYWRFHS